MSTADTLVTVDEIERKYTAAADLELPSMSGLPGVADGPVRDSVHLSAQYYDTAEFRLLRAGITLRRREGGDDAGWHLKLPVDAQTRTEMRLPLEAGTDPPAPLADLLAGVTRGQPLLPLVLITTERSRQRLYDAQGVLLAEVVEDLVTAEGPGATASRSWREIEVEQATATGDLIDAIQARLVELGAGRSSYPSKLARALEHTPAAPSTPHERASADPRAVLGDFLRDQLLRLDLSDIAVRRDAPESVHEMRKAARRLRSALDTYAPDLGLTDTIGAAVTDLRWLGQRLSGARDLEVQWARITERIADATYLPAREATLARIDEYFSERSVTARTLVTSTLTSERYLALLRDLDRIVQLAAAAAPAGGPRPRKKDLMHSLERASRKVSRRVDTVAAADTAQQRDERIHKVRKAAKRLRYAIEAIRPAAPKRAKRALSRFNEFQDVLGEFQDSVVARRVLYDIAAAHPHTAESTFGLGILHQQEADIGENHAARLAPTWHTASRAARRLWR